MSDDLALMNWLEDLSRYGATLMGDVPVREGPVNDLQKRVNFERITHYGYSHDFIFYLWFLFLHFFVVFAGLDMPWKCVPIQATYRTLTTGLDFIQT